MVLLSFLFPFPSFPVTLSFVMVVVDLGELYSFPFPTSSTLYFISEVKSTPSLLSTHWVHTKYDPTYAPSSRVIRILTKEMMNRKARGHAWKEVENTGRRVWLRISP